MTVFRKSVSWSKFNLALSCPLRLQKTIDKEFSTRYGEQSNAASMGKLVQKVFELYFNGSFNLKVNGQNPVVLERILDKVLVSKWAEDEGVKPEFREPALEQVNKGLGYFREIDVLNSRVRSEVPMQVTFAGFRMFGMLDFLVEKEKICLLYDGKGNAAEDADPLQLLYYALMVHSSSGKYVSGGFVYWKHGYRGLDMSPEALYNFTNEEFARGRKIFERLKLGVDKLESNPSSQSCHFCNWKKTCVDSYYTKVPGVVFEGITEIGF